MVVWKVIDSAEAMFQVDNYENFVHVQSEAALRNLATTHPYDAHVEGQMSLRGNTAVVADALKQAHAKTLNPATQPLLAANKATHVVALEVPADEAEDSGGASAVPDDAADSEPPPDQSST